MRKNSWNLISHYGRKRSPQARPVQLHFQFVNILKSLQYLVTTNKWGYFDLPFERKPPLVVVRIYVIYMWWTFASLWKKTPLEVKTFIMTVHTFICGSEVDSWASGITPRVLYSSFCFLTKVQPFCERLKNYLNLCWQSQPINEFVSLHHPPPLPDYFWEIY